VSYTLCLVTASFFAGAQAAGTTDASAPAPNPVPAPLVQQVTPTAQPDATPPAPLRLRDKIRNLFTLHNEPKDPTPSSPTVVNQAPPSWLQRPPAGTNNPPQATTTVTALRPNLTPVPAGPNDLDKAGHEQDYSWITGRLTRDGGHWVIRYAGPNEVDRFGGRLPLAGNFDASGLREGALVCAIGQVVAGGRAAHGPSGPVYQVRQINPIEPARR
jgi:hypothetical protein